MSSKLVLLFVVLLGLGCSPLHGIKIPGKHVDNDAVGRKEEQKHRAQYQATRDSKELTWLMAFRVDNGMTLETVNRVLGEKGKRTTPEPSEETAKEGTHHNDGTYRYGPDDQGNTYQLTFKGGRLVEYVRPEMDKGSSRKLAQKPTK